MSTTHTWKPIRVFIADDHSVVRQGIQMLLSTEPTIEIVGEAASGEQAVELVPPLAPDVVLMDLVMPGGGGVPAITALKRHDPNIRILVLTTFEDEDNVRAALEAGADGYLLKDAGGEALLNAIRAARRGDMPLDPHVTAHVVRAANNPPPANASVHLSEREMQVLRYIADGLTNRQIAQHLGISPGTAKVHVSSILAKLNVTSRTEAAVRAVQLGILSRRDTR
jgi:two-component system, NarL family, response regulator LiaR